MEEYWEECLQLEEILKEVFNLVVSETEKVLEKKEAELARPKKLWFWKWINRRPNYGVSYQYFEALTAEDMIQYQCHVQQGEPGVLRDLHSAFYSSTFYKCCSQSGCPLYLFHVWNVQFCKIPHNTGCLFLMQELS